MPRHSPTCRDMPQNVAAVSAACRDMSWAVPREGQTMCIIPYTSVSPQSCARLRWRAFPSPSTLPPPAPSRTPTRTCSQSCSSGTLRRWAWCNREGLPPSPPYRCKGCSSTSGSLSLSFLVRSSRKHGSKRMAHVR